MSNLLNDAEGRNAILTAQRFLLERRLSRFFKRNLVIDYQQFSMGTAEFDLATLLGALNEGHDDEIRDLYRLLGTVGGMSVSIADTSIYVDGTNGSDITGTGSAARPYQTLWFIDSLPKRINHIYRVLIMNTVTQSEDLIITNDFGGDGCLSFIGVGVETEMYSALSGTVSAAPVNMYNAGVQIQTSIDPTSPVFNCFVQYTDGAAINRALPVDERILSASAWGWMGILTPRSTFIPASGDSYRFIVPSPTIDLQDKVSLNILANGKGSMDESLTGRQSAVNFANLTVTVNNSTGCERKIIVDSTVDVGFWFTRFVVGKGNGSMVVFKSRVNTTNPVDDGIEALTLATVENIEHYSSGMTPESCGLLICQGTPYQYDETGYPVVGVEKNPEIWCVTCSARWEFLRSNFRVYRCSSMAFELEDSKGVFDTVCAWAISVGGVNALKPTRSEIKLKSFCLGVGSTLINAENSLIDQSTNVGHDSTVMQPFVYVVRMYGLSRYFLNAAWAGSAPTAADITWENTPVPGSSAFPAIGSFVTDGLWQVALRGTV